MDCLPQSAVLLSTLVVGNIIVWMVMIVGIGLGVIHLGGCPAQPLIPIYLIVLGVASLVSLLLTYAHTSTKEGAVRVLTSVCISVLYLFNFCWFVSGTVWVYAIYPPNYTSGAAGCHRTIYLFAFLFTSLCWALVVLTLFCAGCFLILACGKVLSWHRGIISNSPNRSYGATGDV